MTLGWLSIFRLGLVQMALGAIVVLTTSTLNRLMVVELALPATLPGLLVALYYGIQITRPRWGFRSDTAGNRTFWIVGGMAVLALGGIGAALGVVLLASAFWPGLAVSILSYALIGIGTGASGTSLLALLATATEPHRRAAAATITWLMMILGIAVTAGVIGGLLDPYSPARLLVIVAATAAAMLALTVLAVYGIERGLIARQDPRAPPFRVALAEVWRERRARNFTVFVFLSMIAYFMQELILEPYAGLVFGYTPGQSTQLAGAQNGGVFVGMLTVGIAATGFGLGSLRAWVAAGCLGSAAALLTIAGIAPAGPGAPLLPAAIALGYFNGMFAVAAIGAMMKLAGEGRGQREGTRMGLWGAAQAIAAGSGGFAGAAAVDLMRGLTADAPAFAAVFTVEAGLFVAAAILALLVMEGRNPAARLQAGE
ncbi:BCD family MFS transporter [Roseivivax sediminis]|uniref:MFS transporter, BCD family, chlorophyll transporter n=1 Tax=Roseivivax sediminis TaxID=936889 RepID=A0A1I1UFR7_9RHOB|nr:BCD family MFS transporter [Roseivivax sediminis]SFD69681.1 MFS transporter, BCD family, chlorophyll transporter [Roseivivax sediminis]